MDLLDTLSKEKKLEDNKEFKKQTNSNLDQIIKLWEESLEWFPIPPKNYYLTIKDKLPAVSTADEIKEFNIMLNKYEDIFGFEQKAGLFISGLINNCNEKNITIITNHIEKPIDYLAAFTKYKNITIEGSVGFKFGMGMQCSTATVNGNAHWCLGYLIEKTSITINGNVGGYLGDYMHSGTINVYGNAGNCVGMKMESGIINLF